MSRKLLIRLADWQAFAQPGVAVHAPIALGEAGKHCVLAGNRLRSRNIRIHECFSAIGLVLPGRDRPFFGGMPLQNV